MVAIPQSALLAQVSQKELHGIRDCNHIYHNYYVSGGNPSHNPIGVSTFILLIGETEAKRVKYNFQVQITCK